MALNYGLYDHGEYHFDIITVDSKYVLSFQVFSSVEATLSDTLLKAIPGCKSVFLKQVSKEHNLSMRHEITTDTFIVSGDTVKLLDMETSLNELIGIEAPVPPKPYRGILNEKNGNIEHVKITEPERVDKGVICQLLKPQYSRSGRELKWKTIEDIKSDEEGSQQMEDAEPVVKLKPKAAKMIRTTHGSINKRKRGRPRKVAFPGLDGKNIVKKANEPVLKEDDETTEGLAKSEVTLSQERDEEPIEGSSGNADTNQENEKENRYRLGVMTDLEGRLMNFLIIIYPRFLT